MDGPNHPDGIHHLLTPEIEDQIWESFLNDGTSLNHIVFLLGYKYRIDDVTESIRKKIRRMRDEPHRPIGGESEPEGQDASKVRPLV